MVVKKISVKVNNGSVLFGTIIPMLKLVHHTMSVLHWSVIHLNILMEVWDLGHSYWYVQSHIQYPRSCSYTCSTSLRYLSLGASELWGASEGECAHKFEMKQWSINIFPIWCKAQSPHENEDLFSWIWKRESHISSDWLHFKDRLPDSIQLGVGWRTTRYAFWNQGWLLS